MDKTPWNSEQGVTSYDLNNMSKDAQKGIGWAIQSLLGSTLSLINGFTASQTSSPSLSINLTHGWIYQLANIDSSPIGSLPADTNQIIQQGFALAQSVALNTSSMSAGQQQYWLIQANFSQVDQVRTGDPTNGLRPFYNSANPPQPLQGPDGLGGTIATVRLGQAVITAQPGTPAAAGTNVPPSASAGCVGLYLINLSYGQTAITNGQISVAGPGVYSGYPQAPFLAGLLQSHHNGMPGQAPQIQLTNAAEVQGQLPVANLIASNTVGAVPLCRQYAGNPNGNVAGQTNYLGNGAPDLVLNTNTGALYVCTTAGNAATAVWTSVSGSSAGATFKQSIFTSSGNYTPTTGAKYAIVQCVGAGGGGGGGCNPTAGGSSNSGGGGGGAGGSGTWMNVPISALTTPVAITIGAGGSGSAPTGGGSTGGSTTFGSYCTAAGGGGGSPAQSGSFGQGGVAQASSLSLPSGAQGYLGYGAGGGASGNNNAGTGGSSAFGLGGGAYGAIGSGSGGNAYGGGGGGGTGASGSGGSGANGVALIYEYIGP